MITEITKAQLLAWRLEVLENDDMANSCQISMAKRNNVAMAANIASVNLGKYSDGMGITGDYSIMRHRMNLGNRFSLTQRTHDSSFTHIARYGYY